MGIELKKMASKKSCTAENATVDLEK